MKTVLKKDHLVVIKYLQYHIFFLNKRNFCLVIKTSEKILYLTVRNIDFRYERCLKFILYLNIQIFTLNIYIEFALQYSNFTIISLLLQTKFKSLCFEQGGFMFQTIIFSYYISNPTLLNKIELSIIANFSLISNSKTRK